MNFLVAILVMVFFCLGAPALGQEEDQMMLDALHRMRVKQQDEEVVVRAQIFKTESQEQHCTPVQQTRQRLKEMGIETEHAQENITINAGNEEVNVTDNHGTINSDVNVQIIKQGEETPCL